MNNSGTITRKVKRCHWPLKAAEADGGAVSGRVRRGGVMSAFGMWQGRTEEAGAEGRDEGGRSREETGVGIFFCVL